VLIKAMRWPRRPDALLEIDRGAALLIHHAEFSRRYCGRPRMRSTCVKVSSAKATSSGPCHFRLHHHRPSPWWNCVGAFGILVAALPEIMQGRSAW